MALEYFYTFTLPLFDISEPSLLWQCLRRDASATQPLCYIAAALGHEHMHRGGRQQGSYSETSCRLNGRALRSVQKSLDTQSPADVAAAAISSLLMAILQGLRGRHAEMLIHLRCGSNIAKQGITNHTWTAQPELNEALRLLRKYCVHSILFDSIGIEADKTAAATANEAAVVKDLQTNWEQDEAVMVSELDALIEELLHLMRSFRTAQHDASGSTITVHPHERLRYCRSQSLVESTVSKLTAKQASLEFALEKRRSENLHATKATSVLSEFALLQCLLARVYLRCCCSSNQNSFHDEVPTFRRILDLERHSLTQLRSLQQPLCTLPFSLGLGAIGCLVSVVRLCPLNQMRHEAIQMLSLCPSTEGLWSVDLARRLCSAIVTFEEQLAVESGGSAATPQHSIPRHCRVYHHSFGVLSEAGFARVRFFQSRAGMESLAYEEVSLSRASNGDCLPPRVT
ncbi:hypothetical protein NQ176_g10071 [Zarea fungicola]|uniref:Uncharacterized protein n=1 Tax=Zarea fungicola TaxID=93591 RepID=A0ACC1MK51_9HYPO|nr:hypothetical protein NQ176_g10071 [Lecanicillium fungicola]